MKSKNIILLFVTVLILASCISKVVKSTGVKMKKKTIDGIEYSFYNQIKSEKNGFGLFRKSKLDNIIDFNGLDVPIHKTISKSEFEKKADLKNIQVFYIDSVSFDVNKTRDKVNLYYYFNPGIGKKQAVFTLEKDGNKWELH